MATATTPRSNLTHIGGWKLGRTLGRGAYAHVRLATHSSGHKAACKILPALHQTPGQPATWDQTVDAIEAHKEVVLLKALSGAGVPGIVGLEGVIEQGGWTYVFLTLYPTSASALPRGWAHDHVLVFFRHLLHSVNALHRLNISHEDLKRSNVLVDATGLPALVDFGFSHFRPEAGLVKSAGGTLEYSSPEKVLDGFYEPKANDVWSLGILLLKLLNLPHPYQLSYTGDHSNDMKRDIIYGKAVYRLPKEEKGPGRLGELIRGMLEREPHRRWKIRKILKHPYLATSYADPPPFEAPMADRFPMHRIHPSVVDNICFLAHLYGDFALCETARKIEARIVGNEPCWEKQWAAMLSAWSKRTEMHPNAIPTAITPLKAKSDPAARSRQVASAQGRALREIYLSPNVRTDKGAHSHDEAFAVGHEGVPPKAARKSRIYAMQTKEQSQRPRSIVDRAVVPASNSTAAPAKEDGIDTIDMDVQPVQAPALRRPLRSARGQVKDAGLPELRTLERSKIGLPYDVENRPPAAVLTSNPSVPAGHLEGLTLNHPSPRITRGKAMEMRRQKGIRAS
ncbi:hypothetical protein IAU60_000914 [Kwoniella sp. DSM 27419]